MDTTKFIPCNRPRARNVLGRGNEKWLPLSGDGDSDRPSDAGRLYGAIEHHMWKYVPVEIGRIGL